LQKSREQGACNCLDVEKKTAIIRMANARSQPVGGAAQNRRGGRNLSVIGRMGKSTSTKEKKNEGYKCKRGLSL